MDNYQLVLPEHLNHYGYLFGGTLLKWVDESAYISARLDHRGKSFVTVGMDEVIFKEKVALGSILHFNVKKIKSGKTSVTYKVSVTNTSVPENNNHEIFTTSITFVCIDKNGNKCILI
ncbi:thioesterase superfamily protein [Candidatus Thiomargarita nelsonii]|uniref:Thioesterase superfamily protein n=1 Tax=Candidatus Thiomargarita nelsonii TaxID=1003181 RepID=A0A176S347_9GAMM|nr:thioesterase superfamily protein [Candidatus Thiomargarita nelsonii]